MGFEASKTKQLMTEFERNLLRGKGIDIGCGLDPIMPSAKPFDIADGDANEISKYINEEYDYVFSSHCLEHMHNPINAIDEWWKLVKKDGHMIFTVPDEDLYEQGYFPSLFNDDHKSTFTISKKQSWSKKSYNLLDLVTQLDGAELVKIELQDQDYNRAYLYHSVYRRDTAYVMMKVLRKFASVFKIFGLRTKVYNGVSHILRLPLDQTHTEALAQIFVIVKKN